MAALCRGYWQRHWFTNRPRFGEARPLQFCSRCGAPNPAWKARRLKKHFMVISQADPLATAPACETMQRLLYNAPILTPITSNVTCLRCKATNAFRRHHIETTVIYKEVHNIRETWNQHVSGRA